VEWLQVLAESRSGTFPQITFDQLRDLKINIQSESIMKDSIRWCETALEKLKSNEKQILTLTKLRDTLLPKLMSGEVRVKNEIQLQNEELDK
jgi:type I restriction enzyme S subunit